MRKALRRIAVREMRCLGDVVRKNMACSVLWELMVYIDTANHPYTDF